MNKKQTNNGTQGKARVETTTFDKGMTAFVHKHGTHYCAKAKPKAVLNEQSFEQMYGVDPNAIRPILAAVSKAVHDGYEVQLFDWLRFYTVVQKCETPVISAQTMGDFRKSVSDLSIRPVLAATGETMTNAELLKMREAMAEKRQSMKHVTPDKMVTCPQCGFEFRVGKQLV